MATGNTVPGSMTGTSNVAGDTTAAYTRGAPDGVATLDSSGNVPAAQLGNAAGGSSGVSLSADLGHTQANPWVIGTHLTSPLPVAQGGTAAATAAAALTALGGIAASAKGAASGVASLDSTGNVPLGQLGNAPSGGGGAGTGSQAWLFAALPAVTYTTVTRNTTEAATGATVAWPDGTAGTYTATVLSSLFPGAVDAYTITYGAHTVTQPQITRDASGSVIAQPALTYV